jgi:signal transduction histidine kinase
MLYYISQGIGLVAIACSLLSFQAKKRSGIMALQMTASMLFCIKLFLLGAFTGACLDLISFFRTLIFANNQKKWASSPLWLAFFAAVMVATGILTWESPLSILAIFGALFSTLALWMKKETHIRLISLLVGCCWIVYYIPFKDFTGIASEAIAMLSILISLLRFARKKQENEESN